MAENNNTPIENNGEPTSADSNIRFNADDIVSVVSNPAAENKKNKLPLIIVICVLIIALIVGGIVYFVKSGDDNKGKQEPATENITAHGHDDDFMDYIYESMSEEMTDEKGSVISREEYVSKIQQQVQEATTTLSDNVGVISPNVIEDNAKDNAGKEGAQAENKQQVELAEAQIKAFFNRSCYFQGAMYADNTGDSLAIAFDGDNAEFLTNLDGTEVSILKIGSTIYIKRPATKQYVELTEPLMNMLGLSADDLAFDLNAGNYDDMKTKLSSTYDVTVNGKAGVCHEFKNNDRVFRFYSVDGQIKQIDMCDSDGAVDSQLMISYFSEAIPSDQLTLKGYTESTMGAIFADLMAE